VERLRLADDDRREIAAALAIVEAAFGDRLVGAYLHGSAVFDGLRDRSDIDLLAVSKRRMLHKEKELLIEQLLARSGRPYPAPPPRPIELTVVTWSDVKPWTHPPTMDLQYGEWLREGFERSEPGLYEASPNPDLTILLAMVLAGDVALVGPKPAEVFDPIPRADLTAALLSGVRHWAGELDSDTRNAILALARIWCGVATGGVQSKSTAADWALPRLAREHGPVLARARDIYLGADQERWDDLRERIDPYAQAVIAEIEVAGDAASGPSVGPT
jgi:streptomycin 3"-adenylyltransferase